MALVGTASREGIESRKRHLKEHGPGEMGLNYANILEVEEGLRRQLKVKGFFRIYLYLPEPDNAVCFSMKISSFRTYQRPQVFLDPLDGRMYLIHSRVTIRSIDELDPPKGLGDFTSIDRRRLDARHLELGFLFVVDPEV